MAEAPDADVCPPRIAEKTDNGIVSAPPSVPPESVIVNWVLPPLSKVARFMVALNVPVPEIPPVSVAGPAAV